MTFIGLSPGSIGLTWNSMSESIFAMAKTGETAARERPSMTAQMMAASRVVNGVLKKSL